MMNDELVLLRMVTVENDLGDLINQLERTPVLCSVESVTRSEFYQAAAHDMQPEIVFVINRHDYSGQAEVEFENERYEVIRSYLPNRAGAGRSRNPNPMDIDRLELICKGVEVNGDA